MPAADPEESPSSSSGTGWALLVALMEVRGWDYGQHGRPMMMIMTFMSF